MDTPPALSHASQPADETCTNSSHNMQKNAARDVRTPCRPQLSEPQIWHRPAGLPGVPIGESSSGILYRCSRHVADARPPVRDWLIGPASGRRGKPRRLAYALHTLAELVPRDDVIIHRNWSRAVGERDQVGRGSVAGFEREAWPASMNRHRQLQATLSRDMTPGASV